VNLKILTIMPVLRLERENFVYNPIQKSTVSSKKTSTASIGTQPSTWDKTPVDLKWLEDASVKIVYPTDMADRKNYRTPEGKVCLL
jgi:hypothetical protein